MYRYSLLSALCRKPQALAPHLPVIAPWREWDIVSREDAIEYAKAHNVPIAQSTTKIYSRDRNIWHISHEGGELEDPANAAPDGIWMLTKSPAEAPDKPGEVTIGFESGVRVFSPEGKPLLQLNLPERAANLCFAGVALNRIFIAAQQSVYAAWVNVRGAKLV